MLWHQLSIIPPKLINSLSLWFKIISGELLLKPWENVMPKHLNISEKMRIFLYKT